LRRCWSSSEPFATLFRIWPAWDSNFRIWSTRVI